MAGESLIDMIPLGSDPRDGFRPAPGGSPANVAVALGRLGVPAGFLCPLSRDPLGRMQERRLEEAGVDLGLCPRHQGLATLGFVSGTEPPEYAFYTGGTAGNALAPEHVPRSLPPEIQAVHTGSLALASEPSATALELLFERSGSCFLSLDPNIRTFLVRQEAAYRARLDRMMARAHLVRASLEDIGWIAPGASPREFASAWLERGPSLVVVTLGSGGALAAGPQGVARAEGAPAPEGGDTVGAGDAFQAALLVCLRHGGHLEGRRLARLARPRLAEALAHACEAAAINCSRRGCDPPWLHELPRPRKG